MKKQYLFLSTLFLVTLFSCEKGYEKSWLGKISFNEKEVEVRDKKSFEILNHDYAKDDVSAYYRGYEIEDSDGESFVLLEESYSKDKYNVYICSNHLDGTKYYTERATNIFVLDGEAPQHFTVIDEHFAKGNLRAYHGHVALMNSHGPSFISLGRGYGKDRANVYYQYNIMDADALTFQLLEGSYATDKEYAFYEGVKINGSHAASFKVLSYNVSKDKNNVFSGFKSVDGVDALSFKFYQESNYAKDTNSIYWNTVSVEAADYKTFVVHKGSSYAKDKNNYYNWESVIKPGDSGYENAVEEYK